MTNSVEQYPNFLNSRNLFLLQTACEKEIGLNQIYNV